MEFIYPYTLEYYNAIIDILEEQGKVTFNKLFEEWVKVLRHTKIKSKKHMKRKHSKPTKYTPSKKHFSKILKRMVDDGYLKKIVDEKSKLTLKKTNYQLTDDARKLLQMNILRIVNKKVIFKTIYEEFFTMRDFFQRLYEKVVLQDPYDELYENVPLSERTVKQITFTTDSEFDIFIKKLGLERENLKWGAVSYGGKSSKISEILYPFDISSRHLKRQKKDYWNKLGGQTKVVEDLMLICNPINETQDNLDFWIRRIEKWEIEKGCNNDIIPKLISRKFLVFIPGITEKDILVGKHPLIEQPDVQEGINILKSAGLVNAKLFGTEIRYLIADNQLHDFISAIKSALISELGYLLTKWEWFEIPTPQERERMEAIFGKNEFQKLSTSFEIKLSEHKRSMRKCKNVDEYHKLLYEDSSNYQRLAADNTLYLYKDSRIIEPETKKKHLNDVKRYRQFLSERLQRNLDQLIMTYDDEGIEELKMDFRAIIDKYTFLRDIIGKICPKAFEPPNKELQRLIIQREHSRREAATIFARQMDAITPLSMETDRRILKHVEYIHEKNGRVMPVLNLDKISHEQLTEEE
jgi:DNA-binding PadR family transcriptional regulator